MERARENHSKARLQERTRVNVKQHKQRTGKKKHTCFISPSLSLSLFFTVQFAALSFKAIRYISLMALKSKGVQDQMVGQ